MAVIMKNKLLLLSLLIIGSTYTGKLNIAQKIVEHIFYEVKLVNDAQTQMGILPQQRAKIKIISNSYLSPFPTYNFLEETIFIPRRFFSYPIGVIRYILLHEATHRKQHLELGEKIQCSNIRDLEINADLRALQTLKCYKCIGENIQNQFDKIIPFKGSTPIMKGDLDSFLAKSYYFANYLHPKYHLSKYQELKNTNKLCHIHRKKQIYKLITPIMSQYGICW